jgi:hypothetical protein
VDTNIVIAVIGVVGSVTMSCSQDWLMQFVQISMSALRMTRPRSGSIS